MKLRLLVLCALGAPAGVSLAQQTETAVPEPPATTVQEAPAQETTEVSDADMQKFAEIYVDVETTRVQLTDELNAAEEPVKAEDAQARLQQELVATIEGHGWSVDRYNKVATAISNDPKKRDKTVELINKMVQG